jgi:hypothetical protein
LVVIKGINFLIGAFSLGSIAASFPILLDFTNTHSTDIWTFTGLVITSRLLSKFIVVILPSPMTSSLLALVGDLEFKSNPPLKCHIDSNLAWADCPFFLCRVLSMLDGSFNVDGTLLFPTLSFVVASLIITTDE